jgi:alpha-beta hydrolase superfamily lysophospholipase
LASLVEPADAELQKQLAALRRAIPVTRMLDYGVPPGDALAIHASAQHEHAQAWDVLCESLAARHIDLARASSARGRRQTAAHAWRAVYALLQCAQLAFNADGARKKELYERAHAAMQAHAEASDDLTELQMAHDEGVLHGWEVRPATQGARAAVVVLGGLSGWGAVYLDVARALAARGFWVLLAEGPGQGLTRMRSGLHLDQRSLSLFSRFIDHAQTLLGERIGVLGNSFGGFFAAHLAVRDPRVRAVAINGAPMVPTVPEFRTAREQMLAVFGARTLDELSMRLVDLHLDPVHHRTDAPMLIVQGGCDPLVPQGSQESFFLLGTSGVRSVLQWSDGEHTIYNHAAERNLRVADWFVEQLVPHGP